MGVGEEFALEIGRVSRWWRTRLNERVRHLDLNQARWIALLQLSRCGPTSQRELAGRIGVEGPSLVRVLDRLEEQGLVERRPSDDDRRIKQVGLTEAAGPVLQQLTTLADELRHELLADIPAENIKTALHVLKAIGDRLEK